jgi:predicted PurR-regulated permease PerM
VTLTRSRLWDDDEDDDDRDESIGSEEAARLLPPHRRSCVDIPLIPRWLAVIFSIIIALTLFVFLGVIVYQSVLSLEGNLHKYEIGATQVVDALRTYLAAFSYDLDVDVVPWATRWLREQLPLVLSLILRGVEMSIFVTIMLSYLLISPHKPIPSSVWGTIDLHIRRYIRLKTWICFLAGVSCGCILWGLEVEMAWVFGLITFVLNFLPNIGPLVATLLPMPIVVLDPDLSISVKLAAFILPTCVHLVIGNFVEPRVFGESFELSPVVVLLSLAFWATLWGLPGMVLSVPLLVCARITCLHLSHPYAAAAAAILEGNIFESVSDIAEGLSKAQHASDLASYGAAEELRDSARYSYTMERESLPPQPQTAANQI